MKIKKAIIPVAGLGTRMLPATKAIPKELLPIFDKPIIQHVVEEAILCGIEQIIFITRSGKEAIENHFDENFELEKRLDETGRTQMLSKVKNIIPKNIKITSVRQNQPRGLGHAILCSEHLINEKEPFVVILPDMFILENNKSPALSQMFKRYSKTLKGQLLAKKISKEESNKFGIIDIGKKLSPSKGFHEVRGLVEKPIPKEAASNLALFGRYILPYEVFYYLKKLDHSSNEEIDLTRAIDLSLKKSSMEAFITDQKIFDCGSVDGFLGANFSYAIKHKLLRSKLRKEFNSFKV